MAYQTLEIEQHAHVATIWLNRPDVRNAFNETSIAEITQAFRALDRDRESRVIVLAARGKAFCAGADLTRGTGVFTDGALEPTTDFGRLARAAHGMGVPLIARVNGACVAGGMGLLALCDLAVAAEHARFGLPEGKVGVFPMQVLVYLRRLVAPRHVNHLCLTGELIGAQRAMDIGLVNEVVPPDQLDARVQALVDQVAQLSPMALSRGKYAIAAMEHMAFHEALAFAETQIAVASNTADAREGLAAFNEKRPPAWTVRGAGQ